MTLFDSVLPKTRPSALDETVEDGCELVPLLLLPAVELDAVIKPSSTVDAVGFEDGASVEATSDDITGLSEVLAGFVSS